MEIKQKLKEEWKSILSYIGIGVFMTILYYWLFTPVPMPQPSYDLVKPNPKPHVVVLDTFTETALKQEINREGILYSNIVYNQARLETGNFKSHIFKNYNNLFGFYYKNDYIKYNHWTESVKAYKDWQNDHYRLGNYYTFLDRINYAEDSTYTDKLRRME